MKIYIKKFKLKRSFMLCYDLILSLFPALFRYLSRFYMFLLSVPITHLMVLKSSLNPNFRIK